jgi:hypothetical protein
VEGVVHWVIQTGVKNQHSSHFRQSQIWRESYIDFFRPVRVQNERDAVEYFEAVTFTRQVVDKKTVDVNGDVTDVACGERALHAQIRRRIAVLLLPFAVLQVFFCQLEGQRLERAGFPIAELKMGMRSLRFQPDHLQDGQVVSDEDQSRIRDRVFALEAHAEGEILTGAQQHR